jgi:SAM-dependent methyltransferase
VDLAERQHEGQIGAARHPWEVARSRFFRRLITDHGRLDRCRRVLDVGAGDGWLAGELGSDLGTESEIVCWDVNYSSADIEATLPPGLHRTIDPPPGTFDLVLLLDVLEHIVDDAGFLDDAVLPRLHPRSVLIVSVPAHPTLFSAHDHALGHERRYRPKALRRLLATRFEIVERGGLFASLLPLRLAKTILERAGRAGRTEGIGSWQRGPAFSAAVTRLLEADARAGRWMARHRLAAPGLSTWAVCRPAGIPHVRG